MTIKAVLDNVDELEESIKALYIEKNGKWHLDVEGVKPLDEFNVVHTALQKERTDHKKVKDRLVLFGNLDPEDVRKKLDRIPELELAADGKLDDKKIDEMVNTRIHAKIAPVERERDTFKTQVAEKDRIIETYETEKRQRVIQDHVVRAARAAKLLDTAQEDAIMLAERVFEVTEDGNVVTKDKVGVTPGISADLWLKDMQEKRPHWWGPSSGGGARNGGVVGFNGPNPFTHEAWNMTEQGTLVKTDRAKAEKLAKAAGTTIGGPQPPAKT